MEERMSKDEAVRDWWSWLVQPQDSNSVQNGMVGEELKVPLAWANLGASDQPAPERMWKHAQSQTDRDWKPRILLQPNIWEAPDVESQAAKRRGIEAE